MNLNIIYDFRKSHFRWCDIPQCLLGHRMLLGGTARWRQVLTCALCPREEYFASVRKCKLYITGKSVKAILILIQYHRKEESESSWLHFSQTELTEIYYSTRIIYIERSPVNTSFVISLAFLNKGSQCSGNVLSSTAKPWFCDVMNAWPLSRLMTGWLWPLRNRKEKKICVSSTQKQ
jgi:hypothetical protein